MKDIYDILKDNGIEVKDEFDKKAFEKDLFASYKTVAEFQKKDETINELNAQLKTAKDGLKAFDGVNVDDLKGQITKLTADLDAKDKEWQGKLSDIEFSQFLDTAITTAKGRNAKAIRALLDIDALKGSAHRDDDVKTALEAVKKDNDYLFDTEEIPGKYAGGTGSGKTGHGDGMDTFRRAAGLKVE